MEKLTVVKLNVGGTVFSTSKHTLLLDSESFFAKMFGGHFEPLPLEDGSFFIDRDPTWFGAILNYLRGKTINLQFLQPSQIIDFKEEATFYGLTQLIQAIENFEKENDELPKQEEEESAKDENPAEETPFRWVVEESNMPIKGGIGTRPFTMAGKTWRVITCFYKDNEPPGQPLIKRLGKEIDATHFSAFVEPVEEFINEDASIYDITISVVDALGRQESISKNCNTLTFSPDYGFKKLINAEIYRNYCFNGALVLEVSIKNYIKRFKS